MPSANKNPSRTAAWLFAVVACILGVIALVASFYSRPSSVMASPVTLVVSGDTDGWLTPCGCTANQSGGLPRRATILKSIATDSKGDLLYCDVGGAPGGTSRYHKIRFEAILSGELEMSIDAHNLGGPEAALGAEYLSSLIAKFPVPFTSANLKTPDGKLLAPPLRMVESTGRRIAIIGVTAPGTPAPGLIIDDPLTAIRAAITNVKYDSLVVLAYLPQEQLEKLAGQLPEADAVVGGPTGQPLAPIKRGPTVVASATRKGKFLVALNLANPSHSPGSTATIPVDGIREVKDVPDDPSQQKNVMAYLTDLRAMDLTADDSQLVASMANAQNPGFRVAGSESCAPCHAAETTAYHATAHAHAWQTLVDKKYEVDPSCQVCHTTNYGLPDGFFSRAKSMSRVNVGCESCHGPSSEHTQNPKTRTPFLAADSCIRCHDPENSPRFEYASFWQKIKHGRKALAETPTAAQVKP